MISVLPPNASQLERALEQAIQQPALPVPLRDLWFADTCPAALLPWLAYALSIDTWSPDWPEAVRRERIRTAITIQRRKGSARSVSEVVAAFGGQAAITEWWQTEPKGPPHTFTITLNLKGAGETSAAYVENVIDEVKRTKPARSHFEFTLGLNATGRIGIKAVARSAFYTRLSLTSQLPPSDLVNLTGAGGRRLKGADGKFLMGKT